MDLEGPDAAKVVLAACRVGQCLPPQLLDKVYALKQVLVQLRAAVGRVNFVRITQSLNECAYRISSRSCWSRSISSISAFRKLFSSSVSIQAAVTGGKRMGQLVIKENQYQYDETKIKTNYFSYSSLFSTSIDACNNSASRTCIESSL